MKIGFTSIMVNDQAKALDFYTNKLGFIKKLDFPMGEYRWLTVVSPDDEDLQLLLEPLGFPPAAGFQKALYDAGIHALNLLVDDINAQYQRLQGLGVVFKSGSREMGSIISAVLDDTCGNYVNIYQHK